MKTLYAGIDLHSSNSVVVVTDEADKVLYRKRQRNELDRILGALRPFGEDLRGVAVESTYNWYWLVDGLMDAGYKVHLVNTGAVEQYSGLKHSDDEADARFLSRLLHLGILPEGYIYPKQERPVRDLLRKRRHLVRHRTSHILSIENLLARNTGYRITATGVKRLTESDVDEMVRDEDLRLAMKSSVTVMRSLDAQVKRIEQVALKRVGLRDAFKRLHTVSGIGDVLSLTIMLEVGDITRFATVGDFASYARCVGGARFSNGKKKAGTNTKNGNKYLCWAFVEAATYAIRRDETIRRYYQRKLAKKHMMVAKKTVAHKLARACYHMLRNGTDFDVHQAFGA